MKKLLLLLFLIPSLAWGQVTISTKRITSDTTKFNVLTTRPNAPTSGLKEYDWLKNLWTKDSLGVERRLLTHLDSIYRLQYIDFDTTNSISWTSARLWWDNTDKTLNLGMPNGVTQQIGQELFIRVVNKTGSVLQDGKLVYISGSQGNRPTAALAKGDAEATSHVIGMTTQHIGINQEGFVTTFGYVRGINTSAYDEGTVLYLSKTTAGEFVGTEPSVPNHCPRIGIVTNKHLNQGSIMMDVVPHKELTSLSDVNGTPLTKTGQIVMWDQDSLFFDFNFNIIDSLAALEARIGTSESMFQKDADSTISALYPLNIASFRFAPDTRYVPFVLPNVSALYGDTLSIGTIISGEKILDVFGVSDGAGGLITASKGIKVKGKVVASNINDTNWDYAFGWATDRAEPTGFVNNTSSHLAFTNHNRTFTITGNYRTYYNGTPTDRTGGSKQISNVTGMHYIYYNSSGVLTESVNSFPGFNQVLVGFIYWNATTQKGLINYERHGIQMDAKTHEYLHQTVSSRYASGMGATFGNTTFSIDTGEWYDEDIEHITPTLTTATVLYKNGSTDWQWDTLQTNYMKMNGANIRYNNVNALADVPANYYVAYWVFVTADSAHPYISLMGQRVDPNIADARANNNYTGLLLGSLPFVEMKLLYRVILRNDGTPYEETTDYRTTNAVGNTAYVATSHNTLTGLLSDDHTQYLLAAGTRQLTGNWDAKESINIATGELFTVNNDTLPITNVKQFTSATLNNRVTDNTGSGYAVFSGSPTFTGVVTYPTPYTLGATSVTTTGTQLNYLNAATGTTGTTSTNLVFSTSPTLVTPILGTPQSGNFSTGTFTWPTFNQSTTGSAAKWTTARNLAGNSVDGSANVAFANKFIVQGTTDSGLSGAQFLGALGTGLVKNTTTTGVLSIATAGVDYQSALTAGQLANVNASAVWTKDADSTISALYPANIASFRLAPDSRYTLGNVPVSTAVYGDTLDMNFTIGGKRPIQFYGVSDGASGLVDYGVNMPGIKLQRFQMTTGATNGYVLESDANGFGTWKAKTSSYKGTWNASTNTPTLADNTGANGDFYIVSTGATRDLGSGNVVWVAGGQAIHNGTKWESVSQADAVTTVNSLTGNVQLNPSLSGNTLSITGGTATVDLSGYALDTDLTTHAALLTGVHGLNITAAKQFNLSNTLTFSGTDGSTLNIGTGGTLGTMAYETASRYRLQTQHDSLSTLDEKSYNSLSDIPTSFTPSSHTHGNITNAGLIGTNANLPIITGTGGILQAGAWGTTANTFMQGNDSRVLNLNRHFSLASDSTLDALFPLNVASLRYAPDTRYNDVLPISNAVYGDRISKGQIIGGSMIFEPYALADGAGSFYSSGADLLGTLHADSLRLNWESGAGGIVRQNDATMSRLTLGAGVDLDPGVPLKFTEGVLTTGSNTRKGGMEFSDGKLYFTPGADGSAQKQIAYLTDVTGGTKWATARRLYGHWIDGTANMDSVITSEYGGTGINNAGRTLTISTNSGTLNFLTSGKTATFNNSFSTAGDYALTLTTTNTTNVTLPTTGTLATTVQVGAKLDTTNATYTDRLHWNAAYGIVADTAKFVRLGGRNGGQTIAQGVTFSGLVTATANTGIAFGGATEILGDGGGKLKYDASIHEWYNKTGLLNHAILDSTRFELPAGSAFKIGGKTIISDSAYAAGWNGNKLYTPSKNALYGVISTLAPLTSPTFATSINGSYLTASQILGTDGSKNIVSLPVADYPSLAELKYVKGVTSAIQTQINAKAPLASPTFTGTVTIPTPFTLGAVSVTTTGTQLNYLNGATGTTGTTTGKVVFDTSPAFVTSITGGATFSAFSGTTNLTIGATSGDSQLSIATSDPGSGKTKTIAIGTGATAGTTNITIGNGSTSTTNVYLGQTNAGTTTVYSPTAVLPGGTSIGSVSSAEISYVDGVTSAIQTQLDSKVSKDIMNLQRLECGPTNSATFNVSNGYNAYIATSSTGAIDANSTITLTNLVTGSSGQITVYTCGSAYQINVAAYDVLNNVKSVLMATNIRTSAHTFTLSTGFDVYSWYFDGEYLWVTGSQNCGT